MPKRYTHWLAVLAMLLASTYSYANVILNSFQEIGDSTFGTATELGDCAATMTYSSTGANGHDNGVVATIDGSTPVIFTTIGDRFEYTFSLSSTQIINTITPQWRTGFDMSDAGGDQTLYYTTSTGTGANLRFGESNGGNPFSSGNQTANDSTWAATGNEAIRLDDGNAMLVTLSLEYTADNAGGGKDYLMTLRYEAGLLSVERTHTFTDIATSELQSVYSLTNNSQFATAGDNWSISTPSAQFIPVVPVTGVTLAPQSLTLGVGQSQTLQPAISPVDANDQSVTWQSSNTSVATVDSDGLVTAVSVGNATITVTTVEGSFTDTAQVTVQTEAQYPILNAFTAIGDSTFGTESNLSTAGGTTTYASSGINGNDNGISARFDASTPVVFSRIGDKLTYTFTVSSTQITTANTPQWRTGFDMDDLSGGATLYYTTSTGTGPNIRFGEAAGNPFSAGTQTASDGTWSPFDNRDIRLDSDANISVTLSLEYIADNTGGGKDYLMTVRYVAGADDETRTHTFENIATSQVESVYTATNASLYNVDGDNWTISNAVVDFDTVAGVTEVAMHPEKLSLGVGQAHPLFAQVIPTSAPNQSINWSSSNASVATVDASGIVNAIAVGTATITATSVDGGITATSEITVEATPVVSYLQTFTEIGDSTYGSASSLSATGGTMTYASSGANGHDNGIRSIISNNNPIIFSDIGDTLTYTFTLSTTQLRNTNTPQWRTGFDMADTGGDQTMYYTTSTGTSPNLRFGESGDGNPFASGTQTSNDATWAPASNADIRLDDGNVISVIQSLEYVGDSAGGGKDYEMTIRYVGGADDETRIHTFTNIATSEVHSVFTLTNNSQFQVSGDNWTISNARIYFTGFSLAELSTLVTALPETTTAESIKKVVLEMAIERAENALLVSLTDEARKLAQDIAQALSQSASDFTQRDSSATDLPILRPLIKSTGNVYVDRMELNADNDLYVNGDPAMGLIPDVSWPRATLTSPTIIGLNGDYGSREAYNLMSEYLWLYGHLESPKLQDPELLERILRRAHAYMDALELEPDVTNVPTNPVWYDQFSVPAAFPALYEIRSLFPGLLLPSQIDRWDSIMETVTAELANMDTMQAGYSPWNINIETGRAIGAYVAARWTGDSSLITAVENHYDQCIARTRPDGAIPYHGIGNPSVNYHGDVLYMWTLLYELTNDVNLRDALIDTQWKGATMGRTDEFWTSPFYKTRRWNYERGTETGSEAAASLSGNGYMRWLLDRDIFPDFASPGLDINYRLQAPWYDPDNVTGIPLPDNYTIPDRNMEGPRGWYGDFNYSGTFSKYPDTDTRYEGHETLMGAMTVDAADGRLNSVLTAVTPRIWMNAEEEGGVSQWGTITNNEVGATIISENYSVGTMIHGTSSVRAGSRRAEDSGWTSRQMWIGMPDRIVGLVSTVPSATDAAAYAVNGVLRFISRGSAGAAVKKDLEVITPDQVYRYGELEIVVHSTTYASLTGFDVPFRREDFPATELTFSNRVIEPSPLCEENTFPASTDYRFVVEVRPVGTSDLVSVSTLGTQDVIGLEIEGTDRSFQLWLNDADTQQTVTIDTSGLPSGVDDSYALSEGVLGRPTFNTTLPSSVALNPGQHLLIVVSDVAEDHDNGWESFEDMVTPPAMMSMQQGSSSGSSLALSASAEEMTLSPSLAPSASLAPPSWIDTGTSLGRIHLAGEGWIYSEGLSTAIYMPDEYLNEQYGAFAYMSRDPAIESLVDGVPLEKAVLPESGWVDTQSWLGKLLVGDEGWSYSEPLGYWIWIDASTLSEYGASIYFPNN